MKKIALILLPLMLLSTSPAMASNTTQTKISDTATVKKMQKTLKISKERYLASAARYNVMMLKDKHNSLAYQAASRSFSDLALKATLISSKLTTKNISASRKLDIQMHLEALEVYKKLVASRK